MKTEEYEIFFERAEGYLKKGDYNKAIKEFEAMLIKWPNDAKSYNKLGVCHASLRNFKKARLHLKKALEFDLKYSEPYNNLGNLYLEEKEYEKAVELYEKALKLNPDYADAHSNLGLAYKKLKKIDEAVSHFKKAAEIDRKSPIIEIKSLKAKQKNIIFIIFLIILLGLIFTLLFWKR